MEEEYGVDPIRNYTFEAGYNLKGIDADNDADKVIFLNDLRITLVDKLRDAPRYVANKVYDHVIQKATRVEYKEVKTPKDRLAKKSQFMYEANEEYIEVKKKFDQMHLKREEFMRRRAGQLEHLSRINSPRSPKKTKSFTICPASCVMMGGRSYKYRNMRKSSRNMRKSHRKSRK